MVRDCTGVFDFQFEIKVTCLINSWREVSVIESRYSIYSCFIHELSDSYLLDHTVFALYGILICSEVYSLWLIRGVPFFMYQYI